MLFSNESSSGTYPSILLQPENLLLDSYGALKVSDFGLSALSQQVRVSFILVQQSLDHLLCVCFLYARLSHVRVISKWKLLICYLLKLVICNFSVSGTLFQQRWNLNLLIIWIICIICDFNIFFSMLHIPLYTDIYLSPM